jgi:hypothetical protein
MGVVHCGARSTELPLAAIVFHLCASLLDERIKNISREGRPLGALAWRSTAIRSTIALK